MATKDDNNGSLPRGATSLYDFDGNGGNNEQNNPPVNEQPASNNNGNAPAPQTPAVATPPLRKDPYEGFSGSNYGELEDFIRGQMKDVKVETPEERKKRERREKVEGAINGIADMGMALGNLFFTTQYAPNAYNPQNSLSQKYQERMDKAKAEREKDHDRYMNYALTLGKLKDADRNFNFSVAQARQQQQNWQDAFDAGRKDRADDVAYRDKVYQAGRDDRKEDVQWRKDRAAVEDDHWTKNFNESVRQFKVNSSMQRQSLNLQAQRLQMERESNSATYTLGEGNGKVSVPKSAINSLNFAAVYNSLPSQYQSAPREPVMSTDAFGHTVQATDPKTGKLLWKEPDAEAMAIAVGAYLGDQSVPTSDKTATRTALSQLGKKSGGNNRTMPGVN